MFFTFLKKMERGRKGIVYGCSIMELMSPRSSKLYQITKIKKLFVIFLKHFQVLKFKICNNLRFCPVGFTN